MNNYNYQRPYNYFNQNMRPNMRSNVMPNNFNQNISHNSEPGIVSKCMKGWGPWRLCQYGVIIFTMIVVVLLIYYFLKKKCKEGPDDEVFKLICSMFKMFSIFITMLNKFWDGAIWLWDHTLGAIL